MAHYKFTLAYDGTHFYGMQRQAKERSVQAEVEEGLRKIGWNGKSITFAGRTDRGVHASGQVICARIDWTHSQAELLRAVNANLAEDLAVQKVEEVGSEFHPRYDATRRSYRYRILFNEQRDPLRERYAWRIWPEMRWDELNEISQAMIGTQDFAALGRAQKEGASTVREVYQAEWQGSEKGEGSFSVSANAFLYHMVRRTVGLLIRMNREGKSKDDLKRVIEKKELVQDLAPAKGLSLERVDYND